MVAAPVGDDVYGEDPTVAELERRSAELLGHESALFCATGSLANLLGIWLHVQPGGEVLCDSWPTLRGPRWVPMAPCTV